MKTLSTFVPSQSRNLRKSRLAIVSLLLTAYLALTCDANAATIIWTGPTGADTNWSAGSNWTNATAATSGSAPVSSDDVKFFDNGSGNSPSNINNAVDAGFSGTIGSLQFGNTNNTHTTLITSGTTLNITGANGLVVGTPGDVGVVKVLTNTITGAGGALNINNTSANLALNSRDCDDRYWNSRHSGFVWVGFVHHEWKSNWDWHNDTGKSWCGQSTRGGPAVFGENKSNHPGNVGSIGNLPGDSGPKSGN